MLDSERRHKLDESTVLLVRVRARRDELLSELDMLAAAWPQGSAVDDSPAGKGMAGSPTEAAAIHPNAARHALRRLDGLVDRVWATARELDALTTHWTTRSIRPTFDAVGACSIMSAVGVREPGYRSTDFAHVVGGPFLRDPQPVGRWAYDFVRRHHRLPTTEERREHADKRRHHCRPGCIARP